MKGAIVEPSVRSIKSPNRTRNIIIDANNHFSRCLRRTKYSYIIVILFTCYPPLKSDFLLDNPL